jgi:hypothetical protein
MRRTLPTVHASTPLLVGREDHRHRLGMNWLNHGIRCRCQEAIDLMRSRYRLGLRAPCPRCRSSRCPQRKTTDGSHQERTTRHPFSWSRGSAQEKKPFSSPNQEQLRRPPISPGRKPTQNPRVFCDFPSWRYGALSNDRAINRNSACD